jgi:hypothetical protein
MSGLHRQAEVPILQIPMPSTGVSRQVSGFDVTMTRDSARIGLRPALGKSDNAQRLARLPLTVNFSKGIREVCDRGW